jgi:hypothetical protein
MEEGRRIFEDKFAVSSGILAVVAYLVGALEML